MTHAIRRHPGAFSRTRTKQPRKESGNHLRFIRKLPCLICGSRDVEAAHIRFASPPYGKPETGMGEKPDDKWTVPLCREHHREQHSMNEREFWDKYGIDPLMAALILHGNTGDEETCEMWIAANVRKPERTQT